MDVSSLLTPAIMFFWVGLFSQLIKSDLKFPADLTKALTIYLLISIGIHGGMELAKTSLGAALGPVLCAVGLALFTPMLAYSILRTLVKLDGLNASAIAAHYGSVSAGTFLTGVSFLESHHVNFEPYPLIMLAIMESPAIVIGLMLANRAREKSSASAQKMNYKALLHEAFTNGSVVLLMGGILVGMFATPKSLAKIIPFYDQMFMGVLSIFLLNMGMEAAKRLHEFKALGMKLLAFGIGLPLMMGMLGLLCGQQLLGFGIGGAVLVAVLAASASYIAVPPAIRMAIPEANPSYYLTLSLGITFPFNVMFGIPLYFYIAQHLYAT